MSLTVSRDSPDPAARAAHRKVAVKARPDRGGNADRQRQLNDAETAAMRKKERGGKSAAAKGLKAAAPVRLLQERAESGFRFQAAAVVLTCQKFLTTDAWARFVAFVK